MSDSFMFSVPKMHENIAVIVRTEKQSIHVMRFFSEKEITEQRVLKYLKLDDANLDWNDEDDKVFLLEGDLVSNDLDNLPKPKKQPAD